MLTRNLRHKLSISQRPAIEDVHDAMKTLEANGFGDTVTLVKTTAFVKSVPDMMSDDLLQKYHLSVKEYHKIFMSKDMDLQGQRKASLLHHSLIGEEVAEYEQAEANNKNLASNEQEICT